MIASFVGCERVGLDPEEVRPLAKGSRRLGAREREAIHQHVVGYVPVNEEEIALLQC